MIWIRPHQKNIYWVSHSSFSITWGRFSNCYLDFCRGASWKLHWTAFALLMDFSSSIVSFSLVGGCDCTLLSWQLAVGRISFAAHLAFAGSSAVKIKLSGNCTTSNFTISVFFSGLLGSQRFLYTGVLELFKKAGLFSELLFLFIPLWACANFWTVESELHSRLVYLRTTSQADCWYGILPQLHDERTVFSQ